MSGLAVCEALGAAGIWAHRVETSDADGIALPAESRISGAGCRAQRLGARGAVTYGWGCEAPADAALCRKTTRIATASRGSIWLLLAVAKRRRAVRRRLFASAAEVQSDHLYCLLRVYRAAYCSRKVGHKYWEAIHWREMVMINDHAYRPFAACRSTRATT